MEIVLNNISIKNSNRYILKNVNIRFTSKNIYALCGDNNTTFNIIKLLKGEMAIYKEIDYKKDISIISNYINSDNIVIDELNKARDNKVKIDEIIHILGIKDILKKKIITLNSTSNKKVCLALALLSNPKVIIFDNYDSDLPYNDKKNLIRLVKFLKKKFNKIIIFKSSDMNFLLNIVDEYYFCKRGIIDGMCTKESIFDADLPVYIDEPVLVSFLKKSRIKNKNINAYYDISEIIKEIYRIVK